VSRPERRIVVVAVACSSLALTACGGADRRLPPAAAAKLQVPGGDLFLVNLCSGAETTDRRTKQLLRDKAAALLAELRRRPDYKLTILEEFESGQSRKVDLTVRDFARRELRYFEYREQGIREAFGDTGEPSKVCEPGLRSRLRRAIGK
jgi:hypothetical protein